MATLVAGPEGQRDRLLRLSALLVVQLRDDRLLAAWPADAGRDEVQDLLSTDAAHRQGAESARPT